MLILIINAGSSSIKYKVFSYLLQQMSPVFSGLIEGIGETQGHWTHEKTAILKEKKPYLSQSHKQAFDDLKARLITDLDGQLIDAVGHRVVHGGTKFFQATMITPEVLLNIEQLSHLAPLHNPVNAQGIRCAMQCFSQAKQVAIFDTGFHNTLPDHTKYYPINRQLAKTYQIQRYGFHGINHEYVAKQAAQLLNKPLVECNLISLHLGNGASACLIKNGQSIDTSMGLTPLAGLMMGTRCGDIDAAIPLYLLKQGIASDKIDELLNKESGLKGICEENDMRTVLSLQQQGNKTAALAIKMYTSIIQKFIGGYLTQISSVDALIFTGGVGENSAYIREMILSVLEPFGFYLDPLKNNQRNTENGHSIAQLENKNSHEILVIPGNEEQLMAEKTVFLCA